ncbi:MAG: curlin repeat-containing protein [Pseudomonadota bacterium]
MTRTFKTLIAASMTASVALLAPAAPAFAGGQVAISIVPQKQEHKDAMKLGLGILGAVKGTVSQNGNNNAAGLGQNGSGNNGVILQDGDNHTGTLVQNGDNNDHGLIQLGEGTTGHVAQNGGETSTTIIFGWK